MKASKNSALLVAYVLSCCATSCLEIDLMEVGSENVAPLEAQLWQSPGHRAGWEGRGGSVLSRAGPGREEQGEAGAWDEEGNVAHSC